MLWIQVSAADAAAFNPTGINTLLAKALSTFFFKGKSVFSNGWRVPLRNPPDCR